MRLRKNGTATTVAQLEAEGKKDGAFGAMTIRPRRKSKRARIVSLLHPSSARV